MAPPFRACTIGAATGTAAAFAFFDISFNRPLATRLFFYQWLVYFMIWRIYTWLIYPFFISPFRHIPEAPGGNMFFGHTYGIIKNGIGNETRKW